MTRYHLVGTLVMVVLVPVCFSGCAASTGGFPARSVNEQEQITTLANQFASSTIIEDYFDSTKTPPAARQEERDRIINGRMALIDANYRVFVRQFVIEKQISDTVSDVTVIGLNSAAALIDPSSTTRILAAIAGGLTGAKASFDKNFYYEQTVKVLYSAMNAQRKKVRVRILTGMRQNSTQYPLVQALTDLEEYYFAGTFLGGLQAMQRDAGVKDAAAQKNIDEIRGLGDRVLGDRDRAREIIRADLSLARARVLAWYQSLDAGSLEQIAAKGGIFGALASVPEEIMTGDLPDPVKWLGGDDAIPQDKLATVDELASYVAGLNNPIGTEPQQFKGKLISVLLGSN